MNRKSIASVLGLVLVALTLLFIFTRTDDDTKQKTSYSSESHSDPRLNYKLTVDFGKCPDDTICGFLVIASGFGRGGAYRKSYATVHGLWPNVNKMYPEDDTYDKRGKCSSLNEKYRDEEFPKHEWFTHGLEAGGTGPASSYFKLTCDLAKPILMLLRNPIYGKNMSTMIAAIKKSKWNKHLASIDKHNQFFFRVCSDDEGLSWDFC